MKKQTNEKQQVRTHIQGKFKRDQFSYNRGGKWQRILEIRCSHCQHRIFHYQKDGAGPLMRCYLDRVIESHITFPQNSVFLCPSCKKPLGFSFIFIKENRPALFLFAYTTQKKIVPLKQVTQSRM